MEMAISGNLSVSAASSSCKFNPLRATSHFPLSKVDCKLFAHGASHVQSTRYCSKRLLGLSGEYKLSQSPISQQEAANLNFSERLNLAWKIIFPSPTTRRTSNASIAKQRLKMILFSDRCAVSEEAKKEIVSRVVTALSDFVEIESSDKVQLSVSTDPDLGTVYSVTVPVRRVRSEYQVGDEIGSITNVEYRDNGEKSGSVDVKFDFYVPGDESKEFSV